MMTKKNVVVIEWIANFIDLSGMIATNPTKEAKLNDTRANAVRSGCANIWTMTAIEQSLKIYNMMYIQVLLFTELTIHRSPSNLLHSSYSIMYGFLPYGPTPLPVVLPAISVE